MADNIARLKPYLQEYASRHLIHSRNRSYCCTCGSGQGKNKTGVLYISSNNKWKCFACGMGGDIIDLHMYLTGAGKGQAINELLIEFGLTTGDSSFRGKAGNYQEPRTEEQQQETKSDYTLFYKQCMMNLHKTDYLLRRGISNEVGARYWLGYCEDWKHPKAGRGVGKSPRLIIPTSQYTYLARDTRVIVPAGAEQYIKSKVGANAPIFNYKEIQRDTQEPLFIAEGEIDALSIIECGGLAVGLGSVSKVREFIELAKKHADKLVHRGIVICTDNDEAGERAYKDIQQELSGIIPICETAVVTSSQYGEAWENAILGGCKDVNDTLLQDKADLIESIGHCKNVLSKAI